MTTPKDIADALSKLRPPAKRLAKTTDDTNDLMQDTFVRAVEHLHTFRGEHLTGWLRRVMYTAYMNGRRRGAGRRGCYRYDSPTVSLESLPGFDVATSDRSADMWDAERVLNMVMLLSPKRRDALLAFASGQAYEEIAQEEGISVNTVKTRINRAREQLEAA